MQKKVLSEIDFYWGEIKMPPKFEIDRQSLKNFFIEAYLKDSRFQKKDYHHYDYKDYIANHSGENVRIKDYVRDHFSADFRKNLIQKDEWINVYEPKESSILRNNIDPVDLRNSPDYTFLYGVDIEKSNKVIIEFDDNRRKNRTWNYELKNNFWLMFPSTQKYMVINNSPKQLSIIHTVTYDYI
tara:strand:+ start:496 stop:1047 length:552 start_codon:yes stop_codon:yes gene_type:complete